MILRKSDLNSIIRSKLPFMDGSLKKFSGNNFTTSKLLVGNISLSNSD
jgi:hypothetical protein